MASLLHKEGGKCHPFEEKSNDVTAFLASIQTNHFANFAVTDVFFPSVRTHSRLVPEQAPDQPRKVEPASGCAVKVTKDPEG